MRCTHCQQECCEEKYPEIVFSDQNLCICEECSIDYEEVDGKIQYRENL